MHLIHDYKVKFGQVSSAFIKMYNNETQFTTTTIPHVSMIDKDKFQIVRRMENVLTKKPLYERIIIDRAQNKLIGFTFENIEDHQYIETFEFQCKGAETLYNVYLYKPPGTFYYKWLRNQTHKWGVSTIEKVIKDDIEILKAKLKLNK